MCRKFFKTNTTSNEANALLAQRSVVAESTWMKIRIGVILGCSIPLFLMGITSLIVGVVSKSLYTERDKQDPSMWPQCDKPDFKKIPFNECVEALIDSCDIFYGVAFALMAISFAICGLAGINKGLEYFKDRTQREIGLNTLQKDQGRLEFKL